MLISGLPKNKHKRDEEPEDFKKTYTKMFKLIREKYVKPFARNLNENQIIINDGGRFATIRYDTSSAAQQCVDQI